MLKILLFGAAALLATLPSVLIAKIYLKRRDIDAGSDTVAKFMEVAPGPVKFGLITLNFINFTLLCGGGWFLLGMLER